MPDKPLRNISTLGLRALRTFDAAARHLNFTKAAEELFVTAAAVSHQVKEIESQLGAALFARQGKSVHLTPEGVVIHQAVADAIAVLERGIRRLHVRRRADQVRVSAGPSLAAKWLVPRLERFLERFPAADIRVDVSFVESDFEHEDADLSIRYGKVRLADAHADRLFVESVFPVCSPRLMGRRGTLKSPQDLLKHKLIHVDWAAPHGNWPTWSTWMHAAGVQGFDARPGIHFQQTSLAIEAAIAGQGIALGEASLIVDDLATGRLVKPMATEVPLQADWAYYLVARRDSLDAPMVREFQQWLLSEARQFASETASSGAPDP